MIAQWFTPIQRLWRRTDREAHGPSGAVRFGSLGELFEALSRQLGLDGALYGYDEDEGLLRRVVVAGQPAVAPETLLLEDEALGRILHERQPRWFSLLADLEGPSPAGLDSRSWLLQPLSYQGQPVGMAIFIQTGSRAVSLDPARLEPWAPWLAMALDGHVQRIRQRRGREALASLLALLRNVSLGGEAVFLQAVTQLRHQTRARFAAVATRHPTGQLRLVAASADGAELVQHRFARAVWDPQEWPNLLASCVSPERIHLVQVGQTVLTPHERAWLSDLGPVENVLSVGFGGEPNGPAEGLVLLMWPDHGALRRSETVLAAQFAEVLALLTRNQQLEAQRSELAEQVELLHAAGRETALYTLGQATRLTESLEHLAGPEARIALSERLLEWSGKRWALLAGSARAYDLKAVVALALEALGATELTAPDGPLGALDEAMMLEIPIEQLGPQVLGLLAAAHHQAAPDAEWRLSAAADDASATLRVSVTELAPEAGAIDPALLLGGLVEGVSRLEGQLGVVEGPGRGRTFFIGWPRVAPVTEAPCAD